MPTSAVIPVKQLENAKQRLAPVLSDLQRTGLFAVMVEDVLTAAEACVFIDEIVVVTSDGTVSELAARYDARIMAEPSRPGLIEAVTSAAATLRGEGTGSMIFLPGDIPLVGPDELDIVLEGFGMSGADEFLIVPADDFGGSNCIACSPPDCMRFGFGEDSFRRHVAWARERDIEPMVVRLPGIGLDVDTPEDLRRVSMTLTETQRETHTHRYLRESGIMDRLSGVSFDVVQDT